MKKELEEARQGGVRKKNKKKQPTVFAKLKTHMHTWELFYFQQVPKVVTKPGRVKRII